MQTKIAIVENELDLALNIREELEAVGYEVTDTVTSGEAAIAAAESNRPDLIIMNTRLTGTLDGIEMARILRERFQIPTVYITASNGADSNTLELNKNSEHYGYIIKPFAIQELFSGVQVLQYGKIIDCGDRSLAIARDGTKIPIDDSAAPLKDEAGNITGAVLVFQDLIECQKTEEKLRQSDRRWRGIFDRDFNFIWLLQLDGTLEEANQTALDFSGIRAEDVIGNPFWEWPWRLAADFRPDITRESQYLATSQVREELKEAIARAATGETVRYDLEILAPEGIEMTVDFSIKPVMAADRVLFLIAEGRDITARSQMERAQEERGKQLERMVQERTAELQAAVRELEAEIQERQRAEERLQQSEERFRSLVETTSDLVWEADENGAYTYISPKVRDLLGYQPSEMLGKTWFEVAEVSQARAIMAARSPFHCVDKITRHKDGSQIVLETSAVPFFDNQNRFRGYRGIDRDISDRQKVLESLRESQFFTQRIANAIPNIIYIYDLIEERNIYVNSEISSILGYTPEQIKAMREALMPNLMHPEDLAKVSTHFQQINRASDGEIFEFEYRMRHASGEWRTLISRDTVFLRRADGTPQQIIGTATDITDRQEATEALRESEEKFRRIFEEAPIGMNLTDSSGRYLQANPAFCKMLGYTEEELKSQHFLSFTHPEDIKREMPYMQRRWQGKRNSYRMEKRYIKKNGEIIWTKITAGSIKDGMGDSNYALAMVEDISDRKQAQAKLQESLEEKEVLLREIHHRVKNNLHVIANLLDMQSDYTEDEAAKTILLESQNRVRTMAKVHQQLCQSDNIARVNLREYIENLVEKLLAVHKINPYQVQLILELEPIAVNLETAIPCGLLINELVTNSLKYAFTEGHIGEILIQLQSGQEQQLHLIIGDNGIGIPEEVDWQQTNTLGLRLTNILARQLKAAIELDRSKGTCFRLAFSELQYKPRF
ncbi:MAG: PAS domain S-box protein [Oscillatoria sp. SIO1A7]|nr:PAS domain S-box protein [Oscillatoria sp. SIO1A7]